MIAHIGRRSRMVLPSYLSFVSMMEKRGVPAFEATLIFSGEGRIGVRNRRVFEKVAQDLKAGNPLHKSLEAHKLVDREECRHLLKMTEVLGSARGRENSDPFLTSAWARGSSELFKGWTYVTCLLFIALGVLSFWGVFITPVARSLTDMVHNMGTTMPWPSDWMTWVLIKASGDKVFVLLAVAVLVAGRYLYPRVMMNFGPGSRYLDAYAGYMMLIFLDTSAPVSERCNWIRRAPGADGFKKDMQTLASALEAGQTPGNAISRCSCLTSGFKASVCEAEALGELEESISGIVTGAAEDFVNSVQEMVLRHEPWMHLVLSVLIGAFVVSAYGFINGITAATIATLS